jgi:ABC-type sugar transport system ATPase subunit
VASHIVDRLSIASPSLDTAVMHLSGGTQQKVVIGKYIAAQVKALLMDEPTRGIDVHARTQLYELIDDLVAEGIGILLVSDEFEELIDHCDRILVMNQGRIVMETRASQTTMADLLTETMQGKAVVPEHAIV